MQVPDIFKIKSAQLPKVFMPLEHKILTTTDFFSHRPLLCREVVPGDEFNVEIKSFARMFPLPFPTFGHIRWYNRCFFVPFRQIMEGANEFETDTLYNSSSGLVKVTTTPYYYNSTLASVIHSTSESVSPIFFKRSLDKSDVQVLVNNTGHIALFTDEGQTSCIFFYFDASGMKMIETQPGNWLGFDAQFDAFGSSVMGTFTEVTTSGLRSYYCVPNVTFAAYPNICARMTPYQSLGLGRYTGSGTFVAVTYESDDYEVPEVSESSYDSSAYDYMFGDMPYRFDKRARNFYNLLISLGYRVDFSSEVIDGNRSFSRHTKFNALKLLAFVKIHLDYYVPSQYANTSTLQSLFTGVNREITLLDLINIRDGIGNSCYDRDYFTSAWQNPSSPNSIGELDNIQINDNTVDSNLFSGVSSGPAYAGGVGTANGTPVIVGDQGSGDIHPVSANPRNISYYILETLRALTTRVRRMQLSGNRMVDRYLSEFGVKLKDDRSNRSYYLGTQSFDAQISDVMSTSDTEYAALGDYAGKGIGYGENNGIRLEETQERGYFMVVSSCIPQVGYVQGFMRENTHCSRLEFHRGDFDNLGTQAIGMGELFADGKMRSPIGNESSDSRQADMVFGFAPRYMEYKVGYDFLTGDFAIPSRREGMDAFHLFRLFPDGLLQSINRGFMEGEQAQFDRIFNNSSDEYDHIWMQHIININARRPMKSAQEVYEFEHSEGREIEVSRNGSQMN